MSSSGAALAPQSTASNGSSGQSSDPQVRRFGRYLLCREIARGGMATVHLARTDSSAGFHKWVAIKTIHSHLATDARFVRMFLNEARLAARLDHPNIGTVFDFGEQDGTNFLAMEYLRGEPLSAVATACRDRRIGLPWSVAVRIVIDAARGLHAAHELRDANGHLADLVHRDISPQNIFVLYDGVTKVVDFGVARSRDNLGEQTVTGEIKGKLGYMAPEQLLSKPIDRRLDVFALGIVLWEMLAGRRLFRRENDGATIHAILMEPVPPLPTQSGLPADLDATVRRALDRDPDSRFATAEDFARALERVLAQSGTIAGPIDVSDFMRKVFGPEIMQREYSLRQLETISEMSSSRIIEQRALAANDAMRQHNSRTAWLVFAIAAIAVAAGGIGIGVAASRSHAHPAAQSVLVATVPTTSTPPVVAPPPITAPAPPPPVVAPTAVITPPPQPSNPVRAAPPRRHAPSATGNHAPTSTSGLRLMEGYDSH